MTLSAAIQAHRGNRHPAPARSLCDFRLITSHSPLATAVLIYGSAIRNHANSPGFTNMRFSNRRQNGGLTIKSLSLFKEARRGGPPARPDQIRCCSLLISSHLPLATEFLIATVAKLESESSHCKQARYQNSNRNKNRFSGNVARVFRPEAFPRLSLATSVTKFGFSLPRMLLW
jgi:hypothetical protein